MTVEEMEAKIKSLEARIQTMEDIEDIKKLQRAYGYYLEHWMAEDIIDCFADSDEAELLVAAGHYKGKDNLRNFFRQGRDDIEMKWSENPEFLHQVMQLCGVVHVNPDGKTAKGRWYGFGANAFPAPEDKINPGWMNESPHGSRRSWSVVRKRLLVQYRRARIPSASWNLRGSPPR